MVYKVVLVLIKSVDGYLAVVCYRTKEHDERYGTVIEQQFFHVVMFIMLYEFTRVEQLTR